METYGSMSHIVTIRTQAKDLQAIAKRLAAGWLRPALITALPKLFSGEASGLLDTSRLALPGRHRHRTGEIRSTTTKENGVARGT